MNMKKIIKKLIASICTATLIVGSLSTLGAASDANSSSESSALSTIAYKHVTTSSFYQGDEQMPDYVQVDGGEGAEAADTVATYATVKDMQGNVISNHHKTLLSLKVQFENDTSSYRTRLEVAGAVDDTGFRMYPEVGKLRLEGIGGIQSDASVFRIATDPLTSFAEEFILQMSFEYGDFDGDSESNDVKVGVYINGALGTTNYETGNAAVADNHAIFYDCDLTKLGTYMKLYTESDASACDLSVAAYVPESTNLTEVTWSDFNLILNGTETPAVDKEFTSTDTADHVASTYILNREGVEKFENTSVELEVKFNTDGGADKMYFGGSSTWYGVMLYPTGSGNLALVNNTSLSPDFGLTEEALYFEPTVAKLTDKTFLNHEFVMKITTEYGDYDGDGASDDVQLGFYFDGNLYNNQYCYVNNYKSSDLTGNYIAIDAGNGVTVKSVVDTARVATADVTGVYKGSSNGQVKLALDAVGSVALPTSATYSNISVNVSDGTTATDYRVDGTLTDGILSLDLTDKIVADATNVITVQAGTYTGMNANAKAYLKLEEDFVCYQDKSSGSVYQKLGSTTLEVGQNFNGGTPADGDLYLVGTDLTGELQGFTEGYTSAGGEWWTIYLTPLNEESGVFRQSEGGESVRMTTDECEVKYPTEGNMQYYVNVKGNNADGDIFTIKGQFKVVNSADSYKDYLNVIEIEESKYQYANGEWSVYVGPWTADAEITSVSSGSSAGTVKLALSALNSTALPTAGTCADMNITISDGSTEQSYSAVEGTIADGILTLNLSDKIIADTTNEITIKAGTYEGITGERELLLTLQEDFICYQDGKDGIVYELLGSTELVPGFQYNTGASSGELYVTGADYTGLLPVEPADGWQTVLKPINDNSGIFVKDADGIETRIDTTELLYYVNSKTQYYCDMGNKIQDEDILTIKGLFRVVGRWDAMYQDSHIVINIQESKYQYVDGIWMWLSAPQATVTVQGGDNTNILLNSSIPFERIGIADNGTVVDTAKIRAMAHAECGVFVNDVKQEGAYLLQTSEQELQIVIDTNVEHGDKITIKGAFYQNENTDQYVQQVVHYAETSFWYCVDVVSSSAEDGTTNGWYEDTVGTYKIKGDINADGEVDVRDIVRIKRWYAYEGEKVPVKNTTLNSTISHLSPEADMVAELSDMILTADLVMPIMATNGPMVHGYTSLNSSVPENFLTDYYFQMIADAGINTISVNENDYASTGHEQWGIKTGLELSEKFGLGYYLTDSQVIGSSNYNTEVDAEALATRIQEYSHYKSFRGLVGVDEPNSDDYQLDYDVQKRVSGYGNLMTALRTLNVDDITCLYPCYDDTLMDGYKKYVNEYCEVFRPNLLRYDNYPFERDGMNSLDLYFWNMSVIRQNAKNNNIPFGVTVQAGGQWIEDTDKYVETVTPLYPNEGQFKWNVNTCLAFGTKAISYFTLLQPYHFSNALDAEGNKYQDFRRSGLIGMDGIKNQWYDYAKDCNEQIAAIDSVLMASESKGVIATGNASTDMELITSDNSVSDCVLSTGAYKELKEVDGDALIGYFDYQGKTALYVVNYKMDIEQTITLHFNNESYEIDRITIVEDAVKSYVEQNNVETLELNMEAGEGILLVI